MSVLVVLVGVPSVSCLRTTKFSTINFEPLRFPYPFVTVTLQRCYVLTKASWSVVVLVLCPKLIFYTEEPLWALLEKYRDSSLQVKFKIVTTLFFTWEITQVHMSSAKVRLSPGIVEWGEKWLPRKSEDRWYKLGFPYCHRDLLFPEIRRLVGRTRSPPSPIFTIHRTSFDVLVTYCFLVLG